MCFADYHTVHLSLESGRLPLSFKEAHATPLLKKSNLAVNNRKNYRPVSNLSLISKIIEKVVSNRFKAHINSIEHIEQSYAVCLPRIPFH